MKRTATKASKKPGTAVDTVKPESKAVAVQNGGAALPSYLQGFRGPTGAEDIDSGDITIPRLKIGQSMSEEVKSGKVKEGDLFLNVTGEVVAKAGTTLEAVLVARGKEYILWRPRKDNNGGILARAKPVNTDDGKRYAWDKPNQTFDVKVEGKIAAKWKTGKYIEDDGLGEWGSEIPGDKDSGIAATAHHNFVVALPTLGNMVAALSLSRSQAKKAKDWNAVLKMSPAPICARKFNISTVSETSGENEYKNFDIKPAGFVDEDAYRNIYAPMAQSFVGRSLNVDQSDGGDDQAEKDERV
jgi:hypothetical protein